MMAMANRAAPQQPRRVALMGPEIQRFTNRSRKWAPSDSYKRIENPPKFPFAKGGLSMAFRQVPPFEKGGLGRISLKVKVTKSNLSDVLNNPGAAL
jgi:hypothetical protein